MINIQISFYINVIIADKSDGLPDENERSIKKSEPWFVGQRKALKREKACNKQAFSCAFMFTSKC